MRVGTIRFVLSVRTAGQKLALEPRMCRSVASLCRHLWPVRTKRVPQNCPDMSIRSKLEKNAYSRTASFWARRVHTRKVCAGFATCREHQACKSRSCLELSGAVKSCLVTLRTIWHRVLSQTVRGPQTNRESPGYLGLPRPCGDSPDLVGTPQTVREVPRPCGDSPRPDHSGTPQTMRGLPDHAVTPRLPRPCGHSPQSLGSRQTMRETPQTRPCWDSPDHPGSCQTQGTPQTVWGLRRLYWECRDHAGTTQTTLGVPRRCGDSPHPSPDHAGTP